MQMLPKFKLPKSFSKHCLIYCKGNSISSSHRVCSLFAFSSSTTTITEPESPELPNWIKLVERPDDEFVLPKHGYGFDPDTSGKLFGQQITNNDIEKLSTILKHQFSTTDEVVQALSGFTVSISDGLCEQILKRFNNDWIRAFGFFKWVKSLNDFTHSPSLYCLVIDLLGKAKKFDLMWELLEEMNQLGGEYVTLETLAKVMRRLAKARRYNDAIIAFREMDRFGLIKNVEALNLLMDALVKENSVEHAQEAFLEFKNSILLNSHTYNVLIHGWCKARKMEEAKLVMNEMERDGFHPDSISYTCFIESYCREKDFRNAEMILEEMQQKGCSCSPSIVTYTILMHAFGKAKEINKALDIYEKMKNQTGCVPDSSFYNSLIYILSKAGRLKDAREVFDDMPKQGVARDALTYKTMITALCELSQEENALKLLREMEDISCKPDIEIYAPILKMCCKNERIKTISSIEMHMLEHDVSLDLGTYTLLVQELCKRGKFEHAVAYFEEMVAKGFVPRDATYKMLMKELDKKGVVKEKQQIEEIMLRLRLENDSCPSPS
ncbi:pentatricopeptide repeat-containing protein At3g22670, mitochondrial-like [Impatiens glandulifera]|uniref:pentatricopeptide repeat-containing protein At3g22670, mitochondrial-like n=1 Tax=Impatiens glandulifera TaxID=253017 RepID=UPI001FB06C46|nr:pentatricopeptide repeat-containing protein At3g22670, mitochondrial-like [Impatiens glandulifera]